MAKRPVILVADPDIEVVRHLKSALGDDYDVVVAKDGSKALELAILRAPELVLFDRNCPLIGATQFVRILRANPRTEEIPVLLMSDTPLQSGTMPGFLQGVLVKPLNVDEVRSHVAGVVRKVGAVQEGGNDGAVSGSLEQISMPDLLQIFSLNRRSGSVQVTSSQRVPAEVFIHEGRIEEAVVGVARGEKALYRLLTWQEGRFAFVPGRRAQGVVSPAMALASTDSLLMEGMRQADEMLRLMPEMPAATATIERLIPVENIPEGLHPVTAEIVKLVEYYPRLGELVDRATATDLEVYLALRSLLGAGVLRVSAAVESNVKGALLSHDEVVDLRSRIKRAGLSPTYQNRPKVAIFVNDASHLRGVVLMLQKLQGFVSANVEDLEKVGFGDLGELQFEGQFAISLYAPPVHPHFLPAVFAFSAGTMLGVVWGSLTDAIARSVRVVEVERRAPLFLCVPRHEPAPAGSERRVIHPVPDASEGSLHSALKRALTEVAGRDDLRGASL